MKRLLMLAALLLSLATSYANPTHSSQLADPAVSPAAGWVNSDAACDLVSTPGLDWRRVSQQPMNLEAFSKLAEKFLQLRLSEPKAASRFLLCLNREEVNKGLAETLMLHKSRLQQSKEVRAAFLHYVINTKNEPELASEKTAVMKSLSNQYRKSLVLRDKGLTYPTTLKELRNYGIEVNKKRYGREDVVPATLLGLDKRADGYSSRDATWMAELSVLAYWLEKKDSIWRRRREADSDKTRVGAERQLEAWGYYPKATKIFDPNTDTSAFLAENREHMVLAFKGTAGTRDLITDARFEPTRPKWTAPPPGFQIHSGISEALDSVWQKIETELLKSTRQKKPLWVTGHSLGAALAQLATLRMTLDEDTRDRVSIRAVYTFGTPRIGDREFVEAYDTKLGKKTFPHVNLNDWVTHVPRRFFSTAREGGKKFTQPKGHVLKPLIGNEPNLTDVAHDQLVSLVRNAVKFLPDSLEPEWASGGAPPFDTYGSKTEQGAWDEHGSFQYLFKLACCVVAEQLWPIEFEQAGMQVPPLNECRY